MSRRGQTLELQSLNESVDGAASGWLTRLLIVTLAMQLVQSQWLHPS